MSDELKTNAARIDGFDDDGATEGDFIRVIQGTKLEALPSGTHIVEEPTLRQELNDELPW
jgi:hypothetical protein